MAISETPPTNAVAQNAPTKPDTQPREKLHGREFYKSLGSPKYIIAPMVDRSEFAWRMLTRSFMPPEESKQLLAYSPMYHARLFREQPGVRSQNFQPTRTAAGKDGDDSLFLDGHPAMDRPLFVQFCATNPEDFFGAAQHVAPYCDAVDLNLGCPQGIARKGHYGAFLQEDWGTIYKLINRLHKDLPVPVTAKFRILESKEKTLEYAKMILSAGASIITLHGRTRDQKGHNTGVADWSYIRYLRDNLPPETVIFANGNILNGRDIQPCMEVTGVDGVMSAEGNLSDPAIFSQPPPVGSEGREYWRGRNGKGGYRLDAVLRRYLDIIYKYVLEQPSPERKPLHMTSDPIEEGEKPIERTEDISEPEATEGPPTKKQKREQKKQRKGSRKDVKRPQSPSLAYMQAHLFQLLRPMVTVHTDVRDALARARGGEMDAFEHVLELVEKAIQGGLREYEEFPERFETLPNAELKGSKATIAEYGRPWWISQPYIRPLPEEAMELGALQPKKKDLKANQSKEVTNETEPSTTPVDCANGSTVTARDPLVSG